MKAKSTLRNLQSQMALRWNREQHRGRPQLPLSGKAVTALAQVGYCNAAIAKAFECSPRTLTRRFGKELERGRAIMSVTLKVDLWRRAVIEDDSKALLMLARKRLKYD